MENRIAWFEALPTAVDCSRQSPKHELHPPAARLLAAMTRGLPTKHLA
jgi:hypothetical protein